MTLRANFERSYLWRYMLLIAMCFGGSAWFAYDGFIGYPHKLEIAEEYEKLAGMESGPKSERWQQITSQRGWPPDVPDPEKPPKIIRESIRAQFIYAIIAAVLGSIAVLYMLISRVSWVEETESGLRTSWGQEVDFRTVTLLNKRKWKDKGIARADYVDRGRKRQFVFDDFKFEREPMGVLLGKLEALLPPDKILEPDAKPAVPPREEDD